MKKLAKIPALRKFLLPLLRMTALDLSIRHPYVPGQKIFLNSYKHKGYWYHGENREKETMELFQKILKPGMHVVEVGGHIGYITLYFKYLVGENGKVDVFEPGSNNIPYIKKNISKFLTGNAGIKLWECAAGDQDGEVAFYEEELTGQNNSVVKNFPGLAANASAAYVPLETNERVVQEIKLDTAFAEGGVDFIKIDVEGFEKSVVVGAQKIIETYHPMLMVEIQADRQFLYDFFVERGYRLYLPSGKQVTDPSVLTYNTFMLHPAKHADVIKDQFGQGQA
ncbi:MAG: FkbM family methyltransferase [Beijerinckiaceae bacterium]